MIEIKIGGVPEYFNLPIYNAIEEKAFDNAGLNLKWVSVSEGTGAMSRQLAAGDLDMAVILTEGITKSIIEGSRCRIVKNYVDSPLIWGVHCPHPASSAPFSSKNIAISRYGSGSHLMSFVLAKGKKWNADDLKFHVINNLDGARASFEKRETNLFLWEKYTTQPLVDAGEFDRIDQVPTPWPCFVIAANEKALAEKKESISKVLKIINFYCESVQQNPGLSDIIGEKFDLKKSNTDQIVKEVMWSTTNEVDIEAIDRVMDTLLDLNLIEAKKPTEEIINVIR
ncbi:MAG: ABC transporter substrate-binding protein [Cyclobacteriaceae bacterium]